MRDFVRQHSLVLRASIPLLEHHNLDVGHILAIGLHLGIEAELSWEAGRALHAQFTRSESHHLPSKFVDALNEIGMGKRDPNLEPLNGLGEVHFFCHFAGFFFIGLSGFGSATAAPEDNSKPMAAINARRFIQFPISGGLVSHQPE